MRKKYTQNNFNNQVYKKGENFFYQNKLKSLLEFYWETFLLIYKKSKQTIFFYPESNLFNYLILAKIIDFVGNTKNLQCVIQKLAKKQTKHIQLEKIFHIHFSKQHIFLRWFFHICIEQLNQYMELSTSYLWRSELFPKEKILKVQAQVHHRKNSLFYPFHDVLLFKWLQYKRNVWCTQLMPNFKETTILGQLNNISCVSNDFPALLQHPRTFSKIKYLNLVKKISSIHKISRQIHLIQFLNQIIKKWDAFLINSLQKRKSQQLNQILYQVLQQWGFGRHPKKTAKWIKNRYWHPMPNCLNFSVF